MVSNHFRALWSFSKLNSVPSRRYLKRSMVHLMVRHSTCPGVSLRTGFLLTPTTGLFSSPSPCHHVPPTLLPEASVWVLKGTLKFSCICHCLYLFWWPSWTTFTLLSLLPLRLKTLPQYGGQCSHILWHYLVSKEPAGLRQSSYSPFLLHMHWKQFPQIPH